MQKLRYFPNTLEASIQPTIDDMNFLISETAQLLNYVIERGAMPSPSIYGGSCGIGLLLYRAGKFLQDASLDVKKHFSLTTQQAFQKAFDIAKNSETSFRPERRISFFEGCAGALALQAVTSSVLNPNCVESEQSKHKLLQLCVEVKRLESSECEVLYGRCGYLLAIHFVRQELKLPFFGESEVSCILSQIMDEGIQKKTLHALQTSHHFPLLYSWHNQYYLGACHGIIGILHTLLLFNNDFNHHSQLGSIRLYNMIEETILCILRDFTSDEGYVMSSLSDNRKGDDILVQWCHGSPGMVLLICRFLEVHPQTTLSDTFSKILPHLGNAIWKTGLLKKGLGLCHGIGGNGIVLLRLFIVTRCDVFRFQAIQFALFGCKQRLKLESRPDRPYSLFEGLSGFVWFLMDCLQPEKASFPGFN